MGSRLLKTNCKHNNSQMSDKDLVAISSFVHCADQQHGKKERKNCSSNQLETNLRNNTQLAREDGNALELIAFLLLQLVAVLRETVEQMVNNIGLEYAHAHRIGHFLGVALNLDVECQDDGVSVTWRRGRKKRRTKLIANSHSISVPHRRLSSKAEGAYCASCSSIIEAFMTSFLTTGPIRMFEYCQQNG